MPEDTRTDAAIDLISELKARGMFYQCTGEDDLREHLKTPGRKGYIGYDPTGDSLTVGNLVTIMMLVHLARAGHEPVVVMGGATGLIGDPSGKSAERQLRTREEIEANIAAQRPIFSNVFSNAGLPEPTIVNNLDWTREIGYIDALRDIGKHFSVNQMVQKESVKERLNNREQGISYTEFSYMVLQGFDYAHLHESMGVTLQMGGSDQWGNITAGSDLIRKRHPGEDRDCFAITTPLLTKPDGGKFGKTESGAVWLTAARTSPYAFFQFWLNTPDSEVFKYLRIFTLSKEDEIAALELAHAEAPGKREPHRVLARAATTLVHGIDQAELAERAGQALFSGDLSGLPESILIDVFEGVPSSEHPIDELDGEGTDLVDLLLKTELAKSKREAREFLSNGSVSVNGTKVGEGDRLMRGALLHGTIAAVRRGKKAWHLTRWVS
ncbi:MAG: tyrosine--tRNA ligase [Planctomycetota bacterium]